MATRNEELVLAFARVLKDARKEAKLTQEQLALDAGIDRTFVGLLEAGQRQPTISVLFSLAATLGVSPETLVTRTRKHLG